MADTEPSVRDRNMSKCCPFIAKGRYRSVRDTDKDTGSYTKSESCIDQRSSEASRQTLRARREASRTRHLIRALKGD